MDSVSVSFSSRVSLFCWDSFLCSSLFKFFFGGMSIHLSTAILAHLFCYDMYAFALLELCSLSMRIVFFRTWGSTGKEVERTFLFLD